MPLMVYVLLLIPSTMAQVTGAVLGDQQQALVSVASLRTEYLTNPLGLDKAAPRFQWELRLPAAAAAAAAAVPRAATQQSYRMRVGASGTADGSVWDSGVVASNRSYQIKYAGAPLQSGAVYHWMVTVVVVTSSTSSQGVLQVAADSAEAHFSMGMLTHAAWGGEFIGTPAPNATTTQLPPRPSTGGAACPWFRKGFRLPASATATSLLHVASVGYHELFVNGQPATDAVLLPSISYLPKRILYRTYNVTALLKPGRKNALGIWASTSWAEYPDLHHGVSLSAPLLLVRLDVGSAFSLVSDASWKVHESTTSHIGGSWGSSGFGGEAVDESRAIVGWNSATLDDSSWSSVVVHPLTDFAHLDISADAMEPTVRQSSVPARSVRVAPKPSRPPALPPGSWLVEMEEVFTGWFEVSNLMGAPNSTIHFQISTTGGVPIEFNMMDSFTFGASGTGKFRMRFAYHEIQYISIVGLKAKPAITDIVGYRLTSLGQRTGDFSSSSRLINSMYSTTVNNYRGLTTGGMTVDCPHRCVCLPPATATAQC
jgi:alpha-L-rhamnosidase